MFNDGINQLLGDAMARLNTALKYGPDMRTSRNVCIVDALALIESAKYLADTETASLMTMTSTDIDMNPDDY